MTDRQKRALIVIDIRLIAEVEELVCIDLDPPPDVVAPLIARADAIRAEWRHPESDDDLCADVRKALDPYGNILYIDEVHAVHQLRGWHRAKYGSVAVDRCVAAEVRRLLINLGNSFESECEAELESMNHSGERDLHAASMKQMITDGTCGECKWCWARRLADEFDAALAPSKRAA